MSIKLKYMLGAVSILVIGVGTLVLYSLPHDANVQHATLNSQSGSRFILSRELPIPTADVSPALQSIIAQPYFPAYKITPTTTEQWNELVHAAAASSVAGLPALTKAFDVTYESSMISNVPVFIITPHKIKKENRDRLLIHLHGGAYVFYPGESGLTDAIMLAGIGGYKIISIDYRMPPKHPYPAALDDVISVWRALVQEYHPGKMAIFGTSSGGGLTLAAILRTKAEKLPLPGAIAPGTPWSDLTKTGDSYYLNEWVDNGLVTTNGMLDSAAALYAAGHDMKDPYLSPVYGDYTGFPPAILTTGTRDLFLSNTVRVHRKLRRAGVEAELHVYEGAAHAQYLFNGGAPESYESLSEITRFFNKHLD